MTPIADTIEALTPAWLTEVLGAPVVAVSASPIGTGQMCDSIRLELTYSGDRPDHAPISVVAKLPATDPISRATGLSTRAYESEVRFYEQLAPTLTIRTPVVHHAAIEPATGSFDLLLEDLSPARQGDQLAGCSVAQGALAVDELVGLHAPRWGDPALASLGWLRLHNSGLEPVIPMIWDAFQARYGEQLGDDVRAAGDALVRSAAAFEVPPPIEHTSVVHGDYRLDNVLFGGADGGPDIAVVDWQGVGFGRGVSDVAYFLGAGLLEDDRRTTEEKLLRSYYDGLVASGVAGYAWNDCWRDYRFGAFSGLIMTVAASMFVKQTERGDAMFMTMARRHATHVIDLDAESAAASVLAA